MWLIKYLRKKLIKIGKSISNFLAYYKSLTTLLNSWLYRNCPYLLLRVKTPGYTRFGLFSEKPL